MQTIESNGTSTGVDGSTPRRLGLALGCALCFASPSTSSSPPSVPHALYGIVAHGTNSGSRDNRSKSSASAAIFAIRRLSGLTWEQIARIFGVTRRAVHFWASGKPLNDENEARVETVLSLLKRIDRGSADLNRKALIQVGSANSTTLDLLAEDKFDEAEARLGLGIVREAKPQYSPEELASRRPPKPEDLVDAIQEPIETVELGKSRRRRAFRVRS